jgi:Threonine/Serine exporter, ThrE
MQGFGLQIGSDLYLLLDHSSRAKLEELATNLSTTVAIAGSWISDNTSTNADVPLLGTFTFTHSIPLSEENIVDGCYRPGSFPWYLRRFPFWTEFIIVPVFSILSSLANLQPIKSKQLVVMVIISCVSYASNKVANHYIFNRSDIVSAIGAFTVGLLGNIYSRKMGGTAFTSMVTGVLFLVPVCISIFLAVSPIVRS